MKKQLVLSVTLLVLYLPLRAQIPSPVAWSYAAERGDGNTYKIKITATMEPGWYIYSQNMEESGPVPTRITFGKNPNVTLHGSAREEGELVKQYEDIFEMETRYYFEQVTFVQDVELDGTSPVTLTGTIRYMSCNGEYCTPPLEEKFEIALE